MKKRKKKHIKERLKEHRWDIKTWARLESELLYSEAFNSLSAITMRVLIRFLQKRPFDKKSKRSKGMPTYYNKNLTFTYSKQLRLASLLNHLLELFRILFAKVSLKLIIKEVHLRDMTLLHTVLLKTGVITVMIVLSLEKKNLPFSTASHSRNSIAQGENRNRAIPTRKTS